MREFYKQRKEQRLKRNGPTQEEIEYLDNFLIYFWLCTAASSQKMQFVIYSFLFPQPKYSVLYSILSQETFVKKIMQKNCMLTGQYLPQRVRQARNLTGNGQKCINQQKHQNLVFPDGLVGKESSAMQEMQAMQVQSLGRCPGEEHGNPLQYSCLENPTDRGTWQAVQGIAVNRR